MPKELEIEKRRKALYKFLKKPLGLTEVVSNMGIQPGQWSKDWRDGVYVCVEKNQVIEIKPSFKGGKNYIGNYQVMCAECNVEKGSKY